MALDKFSACILDTQFEKYHAFKPTHMNLEAEISILAVQAHYNLFDQNMFNLLGVFFLLWQEIQASVHIT
jgi:hypothetical protein